MKYSTGGWMMYTKKVEFLRARNQRFLSGQGKAYYNAITLEPLPFENFIKSPKAPLKPSVFGYC